MAKKKAEVAAAPEAPKGSIKDQLREYLQKHPDQKNKDVVAHFVSLDPTSKESTLRQYVSQVRTELGLGKKKKKRDKSAPLFDGPGARGQGKQHSALAGGKLVTGGLNADVSALADLVARHGAAEVSALAITLGSR